MKLPIRICCFLVVAFWVHGSALTATACTCAPTNATTPEDEAKLYFNHTRVIFEGVVESERPDDSPGGGRIYTFRVLKPYKGVNRPTMQISASTDRCWVTFERKIRYLVLAQGDPDKEIQYTNLCNSSGPVESLKERIMFFEQLAKIPALAPPPRRREENPLVPEKEDFFPQRSAPE